METDRSAAPGGAAAENGLDVEPADQRGADDRLLPIPVTPGRAPRRNNDRYVVGSDGSIERRVQKRHVHPAFERRATGQSGVHVAS